MVFPVNSKNGLAVPLAVGPTGQHTTTATRLIRIFRLSTNKYTQPTRSPRARTQLSWTR